MNTAIKFWVFLDLRNFLTISREGEACSTQLITFIRYNLIRQIFESE